MMEKFQQNQVISQMPLPLYIVEKDSGKHSSEIILRDIRVRTLSESFDVPAEVPTTPYHRSHVKQD